MNGFSLSRYT